MTQSKFEEFIAEQQDQRSGMPGRRHVGHGARQDPAAQEIPEGQPLAGLRIPEEVFTLTINGRFVSDTEAVSDSAIDIYMEPDADTIRIVPWYTEPTAQVICDAFHLNDEPVDISPRHVLKRVLRALQGQGLAAGDGARTRILSGARRTSILTIRLMPPSAAQAARNPAARPMASMPPMISIPIVEDIYDYCEAQELDVDTLSHESGPGPA